jgi:hypothetical protein
MGLELSCPLAVRPALDLAARCSALNGAGQDDFVVDD